MGETLSVCCLILHLSGISVKMTWLRQMYQVVYLHFMYLLVEFS